MCCCIGSFKNLAFCADLSLGTSGRHPASYIYPGFPGCQVWFLVLFLIFLEAIFHLVIVSSTSKTVFFWCIRFFGLIKITKKHSWIEKYWIKYHGMGLGNKFHTLDVKSIESAQF